MKQDENFEISTEARDYNNQDEDDSHCDRDISSEDYLEPDGQPNDPFKDPYMRLEGGMATTESYTLWSNLMPVFAEISRLDFFKTEIKTGRKCHKDFYVNFRLNLLEKFDNAVGERLDGAVAGSLSRFGNSD